MLRAHRTRPKCYEIIIFYFTVKMYQTANQSDTVEFVKLAGDG